MGNGLISKLGKGLAGVALGAATLLGTGRDAEATLIPVNDFGDIMNLVNPTGGAHGVNNSYSDLVLNGSLADKKVKMGALNSYGEYCGYSNSKNNSAETASRFFGGALFGPDSYGYWGLGNGESPSSYVIVLDELENGIGNWEPTDDNDLGLGGTLHLGSDDIIGSANITGNTAAWGGSNYLGHWDVTPEPTTISLLALGGLALTRKRRR